MNIKIICVALLLLIPMLGCGSGGGGDNEDRSSEAVQTADNGELILPGHPYFPLSKEMAWYYDAQSGPVTVDKQTISGVKAFSMLQVDGSKEYFVSDDTAIGLFGYYLPVVDIKNVGTFSVDIHFDQRVNIYNNDTPKRLSVGTSVKATATLSSTANESEKQVQNIDASISFQYAGDEEVTAPYGTFNTKRIVYSVLLSVMIDGEKISVPLSVTLWIAEGVGTVKRLSNGITSALTDLAINDIDRDGVTDAIDAFPQDPNESVDTDKDGVGNNSDADDDNDQVEDGDDPDPLDSDIPQTEKPDDTSGETLPTPVTGSIDPLDHPNRSRFTLSPYVTDSVNKNIIAGTWMLVGHVIENSPVSDEDSTDPAAIEVDERYFRRVIVIKSNNAIDFCEGYEGDSEQFKLDGQKAEIGDSYKYMLEMKSPGRWEGTPSVSDNDPEFISVTGTVGMVKISDSLSPTLGELNLVSSENEPSQESQSLPINCFLDEEDSSQGIEDGDKITGNHHSLNIGFTLQGLRRYVELWTDSFSINGDAPIHYFEMMVDAEFSDQDFETNAPAGETASAGYNQLDADGISASFSGDGHEGTAEGSIVIEVPR